MRYLGGFAVSELRNYLVEGFIPRDRLRDEECRGVRKNATGTWVRIGTFRTWGPKSAVEKALRQSWARDERASKFRATLIPERRPPARMKA
jgi:hypothetical protein